MGYPRLFELSLAKTQPPKSMRIAVHQTTNLLQTLFYHGKRILRNSFQKLKRAFVPTHVPAAGVPLSQRQLRGRVLLRRRVRPEPVRRRREVHSGATGSVLPRPVPGVGSLQRLQQLRNEPPASFRYCHCGHQQPRRCQSVCVYSKGRAKNETCSGTGPRVSSIGCDRPFRPAMRPNKAKTTELSGGAVPL